LLLLVVAVVGITTVAEVGLVDLELAPLFLLLGVSLTQSLLVLVELVA
jgi:hypothetical protein